MTLDERIEALEAMDKKMMQEQYDAKQTIMHALGCYSHMMSVIRELKAERDDAIAERNEAWAELHRIHVGSKP